MTPDLQEAINQLIDAWAESARKMYVEIAAEEKRREGEKK